MGYERYPRGNNPQDDYYGRSEVQDYGRDYGGGRSGSYSSARDYRAAGAFDRDRDDDRRSYGQRDYGHSGYGRDEGSRYGARDRDEGRSGGQRYGQSSYGQSSYGQGGNDYRGSYASDGRRFENVGRYRDRDDDDRRDYGRRRDHGANYGRQPQGYDYDDRGFFARAGDEVRSWFGDEDAERRREADSRYDDRYYAQQSRQSDHDYHSWRSSQIAAFDRDYDEYRQENRSKFDTEFGTWRNERQTQRASLDKVQEHDEVVGSDGSHVGTVDKVRGDRILLTKSDPDAGGQHHSIPSRWISAVEGKKVTLSKTADEAKQHWRTEEKNQALFGYGDQNRDRSSDATRGTTGSQQEQGDTQGRTNLNRSFSGTY